MTVLALGLAEILRVTVGSNYHELIPGQVYRSAQPSAELIEWLATTKGIRTVINLRGVGSDWPWYEEEAEACRRHGLSLENLTFSASRLPSSKEVRRLVEVLDRADKPYVVHCRQGADRTGLASAIALLTQSEMSCQEARQALSLRTGHWRWGPTHRIDDFFDDYERWLAAEVLPHSPETFRRWLHESYDARVARYQVTSARRLQQVPRRGQPLAYRLTFRNTSTHPWMFRTLGRSGVHLAYVLHHCATRWSHEDRGGFLDRTVNPGEDIELTAMLPPLPLPGRYRLRVDLLQEGHAWFHQLGAEPWEEEFEVP